MPYATVNGNSLYYELHGASGEELVLVHGFSGDISDWQHQVPEFSGTHRVLVLDQRGHGRSAAPTERSSYTIPQMAQDVQGLAEHVGFHRYHLVGHSMGGGVVQEVALQSPGTLLSLTLEGTSYRFALNASPEMVASHERRRALAESQGMAAVAAEPPAAPPPPHMPPERTEQEKERLARMSVDAFIGAWEGLAGWEGAEGRTSRIGVPTLIILGELDSTMLVQGSMRLAQLIPNATMEVIPEAGHSPQWERPDLFNPVLRRFLESNAAS